MANPFRHEDQFLVSKLQVKIYIIGYGHFGESIVVLFMDGENVFYSMLIDSYEVKCAKHTPYINKAVDLLNKNHVNKLDMICWTHPHEDHTKGLGSIIKKKTDSDTIMIFPEFVQNNSADIIKLKSCNPDIINMLVRYSREEMLTVIPIGVPKKRFTCVDDFTIVNIYDDTDSHEVNISALTPQTHLLFPFVNSIKCPDVNDLSISLVVDVDGYRLYFGGDTTNEQISCCDKRILKSCKFIKLPHHGSDTASKLLDYIPTQLDGICTTIYHDNLPKENVIGWYKDRGEVYCTGNKTRRKELDYYGIIEYEYKFDTPNDIEQNVKLYNNAVQL